jgi:hypothetical protein
MANHNQVFVITCNATKENLHLTCNHYNLHDSGVTLYDNKNEWLGYVPLHSLVCITKSDKEV